MSSSDQSAVRLPRLQTTRDGIDFRAYHGERDFVGLAFASATERFAFLLS